MNLFGDALEYFKKNIKEIVLLINVVGFVNYYIYYKSFGIPIFNYVGLNDLIFFVLEFVFPIVLIIVVVEYFILHIYMTIRLMCETYLLSRRRSVQLLYYSNQKAQDRIDEIFANRFRKELRIINYIILILSPILVFFLPVKLSIMSTLTVCIIYFFGVPKKKRDGYILVTIITGILVFLMFYYIGVDNIDKRENKQDYSLSFVENGQLITTKKGESTLNYIGESSVAIFLYDIERKEARIYDKSNISDIRIQSNEMLEIIKVDIVNSSLYKFIFEEEQP